jgi:hypothetical protein
MWNGAAPTTTVLPEVATGATIKTLLQVKLGRAGVFGKVVEYGISFAGFAAAEPVNVELISTGAVAATVTAYATTDIVPLSPGTTVPTDLDPFDWGTAASGYTASAEGTITASRLHDAQLVAPTNQFVKQWPLGREPEFDHTDFLRIRVLAPATVNAICYVVIEV